MEKPKTALTLWSMHQMLRGAIKTDKSFYSSVSVQHTMNADGTAGFLYSFYTNHDTEGHVNMTAKTPEALLARLKAYEAIGEIADIVLPTE